MKYICLQESENDCGFACLKMMLAYYHKRKDYLYLPNRKEDAYSLFDLKEIGKEYGLSLQGGKCEDKSLILSKKRCICQITIENKQHFVFFEEFKNEKVYMIDPSFGKCVISKDLFLEMFTGYVLEYITHQKNSFSKKMNKFSRSLVVAYSSTFIIDFTLAYLISFFSMDSKYFLLLVLCCIGICFSIIAKSLIIKMNYRYIDRTYFDKSDLSISLESKKMLLGFKSLYVDYIYGLINSFGVIGIVGLVLLVNDVLNVVIFFFISACYLIKKIVNNQRISREYLLMINECRFLFGNESKNSYGKIGKITDSLINSSISFRIILFVFIVLLIAVINYFNNFNSLSFMIFSFGCYLVVIDRIENILYKKNRTKLEYDRSFNIILHLNEKE